jgi:hypothetical protein
VRFDSIDSEILRMSKEFGNEFHAIAKECNLQFRLSDLKLIVFFFFTNLKLIVETVLY